MNDDDKARVLARGAIIQSILDGTILPPPEERVPLAPRSRRSAKAMTPEPPPKAKKTAKAPKAQAKSEKTAKAPRKPTRRLRRTGSKVFDVTAKATGEHADLLNVYGYLTIDYHGDKPFNMVFDPEDEEIENSESGILGFMQSERTIVIRDDEGTTWRFAIEEEDEDEDEEDDTDYSHPFNRD